jgi:hypothetical protein
MWKTKLTFLFLLTRSVSLCELAQAGGWEDGMVGRAMKKKEVGWNIILH